MVMRSRGRRLYTGQYSKSPLPRDWLNYSRRTVRPRFLARRKGKLALHGDIRQVELTEVPSRGRRLGHGYDLLFGQFRSIRDGGLDILTA